MADDLSVFLDVSDMARVGLLHTGKSQLGEATSILSSEICKNEQPKAYH